MKYLLTKSLIATAGITFFTLLSPFKTLGATFDSFQVFGDSLSDPGNLYKLTGNLSPYPYPPSPPYANGRFSNGPLWIEYLQQDFGLPDSAVLNLAYGGATSSRQNVAELLFTGDFPGLLDEIDSFVSNPFLSTFDARDLFVVWAGANDYLFGFSNNPDAVVGNIIAAVQTLISPGVGAKTVIVPNLPDLGKLPSQAGIPGMTDLALKHNQKLATALETLQNAPSTAATLIPLDIYSLFENTYNDPSRYGLTNVTDACLNTTTGQICANPSEYLFWDGFHPTTVTHRAIAGLASTTLTSVPEPDATGAIVIVAFVGLGVKVAQVTMKRKPNRASDPAFRVKAVEGRSKSLLR
ncbi:GDSL family lipase [Microcystis aeruginosa NIES-87]|uniref:SGNH/GDSL hydrolase family protein n=1 Tax=Microcystis aeruginosa TaxID=1126 RepID=UPI000CB02826|nr:SGNH/GDSL hydrolase family protein [Microcystis aeruginosa]WNF14868.1 SGNH/GDSL hydrolase family protein [Microcystis aeruginosa NRERC-214]GBE76325.1 GDSL family lipase [Microcystis aeruginosa NIES-87]